MQHIHMINPRNIIIAISLLCIAVVAIFFVSSKTNYFQAKNVEPSQDVKPVFINPFATTSIKAEAAFVYAPAINRTLYKLNSLEPMPLASVTKIMTAYIASAILEDTDIITITYEDTLPDGESGLYPGEMWKFSDMRDIMLVASANDAAEAIRRTADEKLQRSGASTTIGMMNEKAKSLGLDTLKFESVTGLDIADTKATAYGSARDVALIFTHIIKEMPEIFESTRELSINRAPLYGSAKIFKNTNISVNDMPSIIASKTGFTTTAGGNVIAAFDAGLGNPVVITILGSTNQDTRFTDLLELTEKALRYINGTYYTEAINDN